MSARVVVLWSACSAIFSFVVLSIQSQRYESKVKVLVKIWMSNIPDVKFYHQSLECKGLDLHQAKLCKINLWKERLFRARSATRLRVQGSWGIGRFEHTGRGENPRWQIKNADKLGNRCASIVPKNYALSTPAIGYQDNYREEKSDNGHNQCKNCLPNHRFRIPESLSNICVILRYLEGDEIVCGRGCNNNSMIRVTLSLEQTRTANQLHDRLLESRWAMS